ncbi:MAG: putative rane protein YeiH [Myxococcaceae bacterium]|nr:putative rane protein YeiH [Myxococcaceae bacterium]
MDHAAPLPLSLPRPPRAAAVAVPAVGALLLATGAPSALALVAGLALAFTVGNPWPAATRALARRSLAASVVGLGAGMDLAVVGRVGLHGLGYTALGIAGALALGTWLGRRLGVAPDASLLVSVGTAICGGSAIAAVAPALRARDEDVSVALVTVFVLNAVALVAFPAIGHLLHLRQESFGLWCALAIHDTSSVVGAAAHYGDRALAVATAAKLARALWIVPVTFAVAALRARAPSPGPTTPPARPWFIVGFVGTAALVSFVPSLRGAGQLASAGAHRLLAVTLFLMGVGLSRDALRSLGWRPLAQAVALWITLAAVTLAAIVAGWIG